MTKLEELFTRTIEGHITLEEFISTSEKMSDEESFISYEAWWIVLNAIAKIQ